VANFGLSTLCQFTTAQQRFGSIAKFIFNNSPISRKKYYLSKKTIVHEAASKPSRGTLAVMLKKTKRNLMKLNILNKIISILIILLNVYFLPFTIIQIYTSGGPMGFGLLTIPITVIINLFLISAYLVFKRKYENSVSLLIVNSICLIFAFILFLLLITTPKMD
jgi:hypothetical protein